MTMTLTDTTGFNQVISLKVEGGKNYINLLTVLRFPLYSTDTKKVCWSKGTLPLLTTNNSLKTCGGPVAFTSTTIFEE